jgi:hypothetical protein
MLGFNHLPKISLQKIEGKVKTIAQEKANLIVLKAQEIVNDCTNAKGKINIPEKIKLIAELALLILHAAKSFTSDEWDKKIDKVIEALEVFINK